MKKIESPLKIAVMKFEFYNLENVFTNVRFRSWLSKPLSVNAALDSQPTLLILLDYDSLVILIQETRQMQINLL